MKKKADMILTAAAIAGFSTATLPKINFEPKEGVKLGASLLDQTPSEKVEVLAGNNCACCNNSGSGTCSGQ